MTTIATQDLQTQIAQIAVSCLTESDWDGERLPMWSVNAARQIIALLKPGVDRESMKDSLLQAVCTYAGHYGTAQEQHYYRKIVSLIDAIAPVQLPTRSQPSVPTMTVSELKSTASNHTLDLLHKHAPVMVIPDQPESEPEPYGISNEVKRNNAKIILSMAEAKGDKRVVDYFRPLAADTPESDPPPYSPGTVQGILDDLLVRVKRLESGKGATG